MNASEVLVCSAGLLFVVQFNHFIDAPVQTHGYEQRRPLCLCRKPQSFKNEHSKGALLRKSLLACTYMQDRGFASKCSLKGGLTYKHVRQTSQGVLSRCLLSQVRKKPVLPGKGKSPPNSTATPCKQAGS